MLRYVQFFAVIIFSAIAQFTSAQVVSADIAGQANCQSNCAQIQRVGNSLVVTLIDRSGQPIKVVTHELDPNAGKLTTIKNQGNTQVGILSDTGATTQTTTTKYTTKTEIIIITILYVYDIRGNLVDVKVFEARYPKAQFEK